MSVEPTKRPVCRKSSDRNDVPPEETFVAASTTIPLTTSTSFRSTLKDPGEVGEPTRSRVGSPLIACTMRTAAIAVVSVPVVGSTLRRDDVGEDGFPPSGSRRNRFPDAACSDEYGPRATCNRGLTRTNDVDVCEQPAGIVIENHPGAAGGRAGPRAGIVIENHPGAAGTCAAARTTAERQVVNPSGRACWSPVRSALNVPSTAT